jgi:ATP-dependent DNA ligase
VPAGEAWLHEPKLDGYRLQVIKEGRKVRLFSRRGHEWTTRLPGLADELAGIHCRSACEMVSQAPAPDLPILKGRPGPSLITLI